MWRPVRGAFPRDWGGDGREAGLGEQDGEVGQLESAREGRARAGGPGEGLARAPDARARVCGASPLLLEHREGLRPWSLRWSVSSGPLGWVGVKGVGKPFFFSFAKQPLAHPPPESPVSWCR